MSDLTVAKPHCDTCMESFKVYLICQNQPVCMLERLANVIYNLERVSKT